MVFRGRSFTSGGQEHESVFSAVVHKIQTRKCYIESFPLFSSRGKIRCTVVFWLCLPSGSTCSMLIDIHKSSVCIYTCTCIGFMSKVWFMWAHVNRCHAILFELVSSCDVMWYCLSLWAHVMSCDIVWARELMWCHVILSELVSSCDVMWYHVILFELVWCHVILFELMWCHVISCDVMWARDIGLSHDLCAS